MSDFEFTAAAFTVVSAACCGIVWSMWAFHRAVNHRWQWLQASLAERDRGMQR
jgi:hypothetical protein